ncbi:MAG: hypothetical protein JO252_00495, partial [Planctomycetaceae bacterium]|nr:hypothetical protein [Planctomycetaceae bacterium]
ERQVADRARDALPLLDRGAPTKEERENKVDNINLRGGTQADYLTARIARDRPDLLERMEAGEFPSMRAAALEAGIVTPTVRQAHEAALRGHGGDRRSARFRGDQASKFTTTLALLE